MDTLRPQREAPSAERRVAEGLSARGLVPEVIPDEIRRKVRERARRREHRLFVGRYLIARELGRGGMGVVYEAWDAEIERRVAVKTLEPEFVPEGDRDEVIQRFRCETRIVGRLQHPSIVTIFDSGVELGTDPITGEPCLVLLYYVMEYLEGRSLAHRLGEEGRLPEEVAVRVAADIASALHLVHNAGIIHRDIKPANVFLRESGRAVLLDFGIAKGEDVSLTRQGQILGTPSYLAPERLRENERGIDGRADIFSLGGLFFTMLTGEAPFVGGDMYEVIDKIAKETHPRFRSHTRAGRHLAGLIDRMLAKRPDDRFDSASAVAEALHRVLTVIGDPVVPRTLDADESDRLKTAPFPSSPPFGSSSWAVSAPSREGLDADSTTVREEFESEDTEVEAAETRKDGAGQQALAPFAAREEETGEEETRPSRPPLSRTLTPEHTPSAEDGSEHVTPVSLLDETTEDETIVKLVPRVRDPERRGSGMRVPGVPPDGASAESILRVQAVGQQNRDVRSSRIEASRVDEEEVIVKLAARSVLKPDELPTKTRFPVDGDLAGPFVEGLEEGVRVLDPAEFVGPGGSRGTVGRRASEAPKCTDVASEDEKSAAVARRTFGTDKAARVTGRPVVRVRGDLSNALDRSGGARRIVFLALCAAMASIAVGVFIGRSRVVPRAPIAPVADDGTSLTPTVEPQRVVRPLRTGHNGLEPRLLRPRSAREILADAQAARLGGDLKEAARLFDNAVRAAAEGSETRARAVLGRADLLRQLDRTQEAAALYREAVTASPQSREGRQAQVALEELGFNTRRRSRSPAPGPVVVGEGASMDAKPAFAPTDKCRAITRSTFGRPREAVRRLEALEEEHPDAPCVFFSLGLRHEELNDARAALVAYRRFVELAPTSPRRRAVDARIKNLEDKVRFP